MHISRLRTGLTIVVMAAMLPIGGVTSVAAPASPTVWSDAGGPGGDTTAASGRQRAQRTPTFPNRRTAGVPRDWSPRKTLQHDKTVRREGAVVRDLRIEGDLRIEAKNVTVLRVDIVGGSIHNWVGECATGLKVRRTTIRNAPGQDTSGAEPALQTGGYTAQRVLIDGLPEGFRVGAKDECGRVVIKRSYARVTSPTNCEDWHGDSLQGYYGAHVKVRDSRLDLVELGDCGGTAPFFYPADQGNTSVDIDGLIVKGGGIPFRLGMPGDVRRLKIVKDSWFYDPIDVECSVVDEWSAQIVTLNKKGQPRKVRNQKCNTGS